MAPSLSDLLRKPFGTYYDHDVLTEECKSTPSKHLELRNVRLECISDGEVTGLTETEHCQGHEYQKYRMAKGVHLFGDLTIKKLSWLTPEAIGELQKELRKRDVEMRRDGGVEEPAESHLTLRGIYGRSDVGRRKGKNLKRLMLKIRIQADKNLSAGFLTTRSIPYGLSIHTKDRSRYYEVVSMKSDTFMLSRLYLSRYRTLRVLKDIVAYDNHNTNELTLATARTPSWFAARYLAYMTDPEVTTTTQVVHLSSEESDVALGTGDRLAPGTHERPLRHTEPEDIMPLILEHAQWILLDQTTRRQNRMIDPDVWRSWLRRKGRERRRQPAGSDDDHDDGDDDMDVDDDEPPIEPPLPPPTNNRRNQRRKSAMRSATRRLMGTPSIASGSQDGGYARSPSPRQSSPEAEMEIVRTFDRDISPPSTPDATSSSSDSSRPPTPPSPSLLARVPAVLFYPPSLPTSSFTWVCPVDNCFYVIDVLDLSDDNRREIPEEVLESLRTGGWNLNDAWVQQCFDRMVAVHWQEHLDSEGIVLRKEGKRHTYAWKRPQAHPDSNSWKKGKGKAIDRSMTVKQEMN